jgi:DNA-binding MarR family transcriptional regulator
MANSKYPSTPAARWTSKLVAGGYTPVVNAFLEHGGRRRGLGLNPTQCMLVIQLINFKRDVRMPYPSIKKLATRMGVSDTTVRNNLDVLAKRGLIVKHLQRGSPSMYDLTPLFKQLEAIQARAAARAARLKAEQEAARLPESYAEEGDAETVLPLSHA